MKTARRVRLLLLAAAICLTAPLLAEPRSVRPAGVAGMFYPADRAQLAAAVDGLLGRASVAASDEPLVALIAPHAGYQFSGPVAAYSYAALKGKKFQRVIVIAPSHYESFPYASVYDGDAYTTPLGEVPIDRQFAARLAAGSPFIRLAAAGHNVGAQPEHALEVELPFLQRTLGDFRLVAVVMGDQSYQASRALGLALARLLRDQPGTLIVASSDLSHYHGYAEAARLDRGLLDAVAYGDFLTVSRNTEMRHWEACGAGPIVATMIAAARLGARPQLLKYANSGDTAGDKSRVVGYAAVAFRRAAREPTPEKSALTAAEREELLGIARRSVDAAVRGHKVYEPPAPQSPRLLEERGAFVTLTRGGELRGCIGYVAPVAPLYLTVRDVAALAAIRDTRFPPVSVRELPQLEYEISVLSLFRPMDDAKRIRVGEHGLLVKRGRNEGVLLPQVPVEQRWNRDTFLQEAAMKAGLEPAAWQDPETDVFWFTALVFGDHPAAVTRDEKPREAPPRPAPPDLDSPPR